MNKFQMEGGTLFHKCKDETKLNNGICEFETDSFGNTWFKCRQCGEKFGLPELTREIAQYYITPAF